MGKCSECIYASFFSLSQISTWWEHDMRCFAFSERCTKIYRNEFVQDLILLICWLQIRIMSWKNRGLNDREIVPTFPLNSMDSSRPSVRYSLIAEVEIGIELLHQFTVHFASIAKLFVEIRVSRREEIKAGCVRGYLWIPESVYRMRVKVQHEGGGGEGGGHDTVSRGQNQSS